MSLQSLCHSAFGAVAALQTRALVARALALAVMALTVHHASATGPALNLAVSRTSLSLPIFVAEARQYFREEGVDVHTHECLGGQRCIVEMFEGKADVATVTEMPVALQSFRRNDFAIFATFVNSARDVKVVVRKGGGIQSIPQLAGRRVATVKGASAHYYLDSALLFHGGDPRQVDIIGLPPEQVGPALITGNADAAVVWEPFAYETLRSLGKDGLMLPNTRVYDATFNLVASKRTLSERHDDLVRVLRALDRAIRFIREEPVQAQAILKTQLRMDQAFIDATWQDYKYGLSLNQSLLSTLEGEIRWAQREGHVPPGQALSNVLDFVDSRALRTALPTAVTLVK